MAMSISSREVGRVYALCILNVTVKEKPKDNVGQRLSFTAIGGYDQNSAVLDI